MKEKKEKPCKTFVSNLFSKLIFDFEDSIMYQKIIFF